jgi:iron complex transport system substrate-binding protein
MRLCSLVPSGTEILYALGLGESLVGVSHGCDYPPDALQKPKVIRTVIDQDRLSSDDIDRAVRVSLERGKSSYEVDEEALRRAAPELIVTQELCDVCAIDTTEVSQALRTLTYQPRVISLHPHTLNESLGEIRLVGEVTGHQREADQLLRSYRERIERVQARLRGIAHRPWVFCLEWLKPLMASGHWVPEMVALAGGTEVLGRVGGSSRYVTGDEVVAARPEVLIVMPCGFPIERTRRELPLLTTQPWWNELPAVRDGRAYVVNGPAYFNRSGPRLIDGIELLAGLLHPDRCAALVPPGAAEPLASLPGVATSPQTAES